MEKRPLDIWCVRLNSACPPENQMGYIAFDPQLYGKIREKMRKNPAGKSDFVVDQEWAGRMYAEE